jgi:hypothetical protein
MTSPPASGRLEHAAYVPPNLTWPSMAPIAKGSPIIEYWPSASTGPCRYAGACEDGCGHLFIRATPQDAAEAITKRDGHGAAYCAQATRSRKEPKVVGEPAPPAAIVEVVVAPRVPEARPARKGRRSA